MTRQQLSTAAAMLGVLLVAGPAAAGQASMLNSSEASAFMGTWVISLETPRGGTFDQTLTIRDEGGKVAARVVGRGGRSDVTDLAKDGDNLVLTWVGGVVTLTLDGEMINVEFVASEGFTVWLRGNRIERPGRSSADPRFQALLQKMNFPAATAD